MRENKTEAKRKYVRDISIFEKQFDFFFRVFIVLLGINKDYVWS